MCVIVYKPIGIKVGRKTVNKMFATNPDGAGLCYAVDGNTLFIEKGITTAKELYERLTDLVDLEVTFHCRIGTSGIMNERQTHPFIISSNPETAKGNERLQFFAKSVLFHNGIIPGYGNQVYSDTIELVTKVLAKVKPSARCRVLAQFPGKYILCQNGKMHLIGSFLDYHGLKVSNKNFDSVIVRSNGYKWRSNMPSYSNNYDDQWETETSEGITRYHVYNSKVN